ncbi:MAG: threonine synthase [Sulfolobaceae archaeon]
MVCIDCGYEIEVDQNIILCPRCGGLLEIVLESIGLKSFKELKGRGVWRYQALIAGNYKNIISLNEGNTPLIKSIYYENLYYKFEGANPTGSFKDRGMTVAVTNAVLLNYKATIAASTGNTAASASAYSARAGLKSILVLPKGKVAIGKLSQSILHGSMVVEIEGNFDVAMSIVQKLYKEKKLIYPLNSFNPWRLEGQKTVTFEIVEEIGVPDIVIVPMGNAGNIYAIWKGFDELKRFGFIDRIPKLVGVQAEGANPIVRYMNSQKEFVGIENPETIATAIRIGKPVNWKKAVKALKFTNGIAISVSDNEILEAQKFLAQREGIGVEPASASTFAAYLKLLEQGIIDRKERVVLILTGHALKDPDIIFSKISLRKTSSTPESLEKIIEGEVLYARN